MQFKAQLATEVEKLAQATNAEVYGTEYVLL